MITTELLKQIDPKLNPKFSPNLHDWLKQIWFHKNCEVIVTHHTPNWGRYIGSLDENAWLFGSQLNSVLCNGQKEKVRAFSPNHHMNTSGIDHDFWATYIQDGRCAIDPEHTGFFVGDNTRWKIKNKTRECLWCGHHVQVKLDWTETVHKEQWVPA